MIPLLAEIVHLERVALELGEAVVKAVVLIFVPGGRDTDEGGADDPLTPRQRADIRLSVWRLQNAFEDILQADPAGLRQVLSSVSFLAENFGDQLIAWTDVMDVLVEEAERLYGTESGRGEYKRTQVRAAVLTIAKRDGIAIPLVPSFLEPLVFAYGADILADFVVSHLDENGLWDFATLPTRPAWKVRFTGPVFYYVHAFFEFLSKFLTGLAWRVVMGSVRLSAGMQAAVDRLHPNVAETVQALASIAQFVLNNPNYIRAWARVLSIATQQAETLLGMSGRQKQAYAQALVLDFLEQNGLLQRSGLWRTIVAAWVNLAIDATVRLFNRHRLFPFRAPDGSRAAARAR